MRNLPTLVLLLLVAACRRELTPQIAADLISDHLTMLWPGWIVGYADSVEVDAIVVSDVETREIRWRLVSTSEDSTDRSELVRGYAQKADGGWALTGYDELGTDLIALVIAVSFGDRYGDATTVVEELGRQNFTQFMGQRDNRMTVSESEVSRWISAGLVEIPNDVEWGVAEGCGYNLIWTKSGNITCATIDALTDIPMLLAPEGFRWARGFQTACSTPDGVYIDWYDLLEPIKAEILRRGVLLEPLELDDLELQGGR